jgi:heptosyltransferase-2/heptosyltransferase-3
LYAVDGLLSRLPRRKTPLPENPRTILLLKPDHLGDLLLTTSIFPLIASRYPDASIDLLCGSWGKAVVDGNRFLRKIICLEHPVYNRSSRPLSWKLLDFCKSLMHTIKIVRRERYDLCLNLRDAGGDLILLARVGNCRHIIGHTTGGFGPLLDTAVPWKEGLHEAEHYLELLAPLGICANLESLRYSLSPAPADERLVETLLAQRLLTPYVVIHPGCGDRRKLRSSHFWETVVADIPGSYRVVVTGTTAELPLYEEMAAASDREIICLMGEFTIVQLLVLFQRAAMVYTLDSLAAHLGGAAGVKTTVFWSATNDLSQWRPLGSRVVVVEQKQELISRFGRDAFHD